MDRGTLATWTAAGQLHTPLVIRDLRDLTRARTSLSQEHSRIASRIQKVLEDANLKLASVASNTLRKSGRAILATIIGGEESCELLADLALGHLRANIPQLRAALEGQVRDHHRFLLQSLLRQLDFISTEIKLLDARLDQLGQQHPELAEALSRWVTVPGVDRVAAWSFIAEMGTDCSQFPSPSHPRSELSSGRKRFVHHDWTIKFDESKIQTCCCMSGCRIKIREHRATPKRCIPAKGRRLRN